MWWEKSKTVPTAKKAVAYYRHSSQDRQENSIPIQREQVREFAEKHNIEIIREFADHGKSGLSTESRDGFNEMLKCVEEEDFDYVLVFDVSRWGRFQDTDLSAYYTGRCQEYGKQVIYTIFGFPKDGLEHGLRLFLGRYGAANYSRELSDKVKKGCVKISQQGFRAGAPPPYGLHRLLLDEQRKPVQILNPGQRKSIQNQRVTLAPGDKREIAVVRNIFNAFVKKKFEEKEIADFLNHENIPSPGGKKWTAGTICSILTNEQLIGVLVYNKTSQKLQSPTKRNPREEWIRKEDAFPGIIDKNIFIQARKIIEARKAEREQKYSSEEMLANLEKLYSRYGMITAKMVSANKGMASVSTYRGHFGSLDMAFQNMFNDVLKRTKQSVVEQLKKKTSRLIEYEDLVILNDSLSILIQPSVPVPRGYNIYWAFRPDLRKEVDITLGVPLSNSGKYEILGYLAFPRMFVDGQNIKLFSSTDGQLELYGHRNLDAITDLLD